MALDPEEAAELIAAVVAQAELAGTDITKLAIGNKDESITVDYPGGVVVGPSPKGLAIEPGEVFHESTIGIGNYLKELIDNAKVEGSLSTTCLVVGTSLGTKASIFASSSFPSWNEYTDWKHNAIPNKILYDSSLGSFTVEESGRFRLSLTFFVAVSANLFVTLDVEKNGVNIYTVRSVVHSLVDPTERTVILILDLAVGDSLILYGTPSTSSYRTRPGTTFNLERIE